LFEILEIKEFRWKSKTFLVLNVMNPKVLKQNHTIENTQFALNFKGCSRMWVAVKAGCRDGVVMKLPKIIESLGIFS